MANDDDISTLDLTPIGDLAYLVARRVPEDLRKARALQTHTEMIGVLRKSAFDLQRELAQRGWSEAQANAIGVGYYGALRERL